MLNKYKSLPIGVKASLWFILCNVLEKGIGFISTPIFTRIMSVTEYGQYSVFLSWSSIIGLFVTINAAGGVINNGLAKYDDKQEKFIASLQGIASVSIIVSFIIYMVFFNEISKIITLSRFLVTLMFIDLFFSTSIANWLATQRYNYKYVKMVIIIVSKVAITVILGYILVTNSNYKVEARVLASVIISISFGIFIYISNIIKGKCIFNKIYWKYILFFNTPLIPHVLSTLILNQTDRLMIERYVGVKEAGIYSLAYTVGMAMSLVTGSINSSMIPWLYKSMKAKEYDSIKKTTRILIGVVGVSVISFILFAPELLAIMGSVEYQEAKYILPPLATCLFFIFVYTIFVNIEMYLEKTSLIMSASITVAIINVILNFLLIKEFGYMAAAYTTLICYIIFCILHYMFMKKAIKSVYKRKIKLVDLTFIIFMSIAILIIASLITVIYPYNVLRYILIVLILFISLIFRRKIMNLLRLISSK